MVRQWQELLHGERYSHSWSEALPDFVKLAEAFGCQGHQDAPTPPILDEAIEEMLAYDGPVIFDCLVEKHENCFPMIPSGKPHNEMLLGEAPTDRRHRRHRRGDGVSMTHPHNPDVPALGIRTSLPRCSNCQGLQTRRSPK